MNRERRPIPLVIPHADRDLWKCGVVLTPERMALVGAHNESARRAEKEAAKRRSDERRRRTLAHHRGLIYRLAFMPAAYTYPSRDLWLSEVLEAATPVVTSEPLDESMGSCVTLRAVRGPAITSALLYQDRGTPASSPIISYFDGFELVPNGGDLVLHGLAPVRDEIRRVNSAAARARTQRTIRTTMTRC